MRIVLVFVLTLVPAILLPAQAPGQLAQRAAIAAKISGLPVTSIDTPTAAQIEAALDLPAGFATSIVATGDPSQITDPSNLGIINPRAGSNFLLLSTGVAGTSAPEPGTGFGNFLGSLGNDTASVTITLTVPVGATTLTFDCRFFSAEYPDFVQAGFNDTFSALLTTPTGTQQLAIDGAGRPIEVDSVMFFPAFTSNAGGTGFDIFAPNPVGVNTSFPGGLPDAGLTDWISASGSVTAGTSVTIEFGIGDFGDDILDSAILIDNLSFSSLEVLDGGDELFRAGNDLTNDVDRLSLGGESRVGICADGVSRLLLRMNLSGPGTVTFDIPNFVNTNESGALGNPGAAPVGATLNVNSVTTMSGEKAYAVFRAPLDFVRVAVPGDLTARTHTLTIDTTFTPQAGPAESGSVTLIIDRPPVALCHGLWSGPATWNAFNPLLSSGLFDTTRADYSNNNGGRISINRFQVRRVARQARAAKQRRGIASTQVDWIGHSMGGLLARSFVATGFYRRPDNFGSGDIHKMIGMNTPHWGSPMANLLVAIRGTFYIGDLLIINMERLGMTIVGGAIDDLREGSAALIAIGATALRSHSICGRGGSQAIGVANIGLGAAAALSPPPYSTLFRILRFLSFATTATIYRSQEHDFIVLLASQRGGLAGATTTTFGGLGSIHTSVTSLAPASAQCITLLNAPTTGATFAAAMPAPNPAPPGSGDGPGPTPVPAGQGINFTTTPGPATPGGTVTVSVAPFGGYAPTAVLFVASSQDFILDSSPPFSATLNVPLESIGEFTVGAIAEDAIRQVAAVGPLAFPVTLSATLTGIEVFTDRLYLTRPGEATAITVMGNFSDGIQRNVTSAALGTTYLTSLPSVATVSAEGVVMAVGEGSGAIIAQNGGFEISLGVFVGWEPDISYSGLGCPTTVGVPMIGTGGGVPEIGNLGFHLTASNLPIPGLGFFVVQLGRPSEIGTPVTGAPACLLVYVQPLVQLVVLPSAGGTATMSLAIPALPGLAGLPLGAQVLAWDFTMTGVALPLGSSTAVDIAVGH